MTLDLIWEQTIKSWSHPLICIRIYVSGYYYLFTYCHILVLVHVIFSPFAMKWRRKSYLYSHIHYWRQCLIQVSHVWRADKNILYYFRDGSAHGKVNIISDLLSPPQLYKVANMSQATTDDQCNIQKSSSKCFETYWKCFTLLP